MRLIFFGLVISAVILTNCKPNEDTTPMFTFRAQILNATTNEVPVGLAVTLQASTFPDGLTKFKKEILGTAITDSMGMFTITYKKTSLPILTLLSQFLTYNNLPINKNVDTIFYRSTKGTLVFLLTADTPLTANDTLFIGTPADEGGGGAIRTVTGPLPSKYFVKYHCVASNGTESFWNIGWATYQYKSYNRHQYKNQVLSYYMTGDPYTDTIKIKYR